MSALTSWSEVPVQDGKVVFTRYFYFAQRRSLLLQVRLA